LTQSDVPASLRFPSLKNVPVSAMEMLRQVT